MNADTIPLFIKPPNRFGRSDAKASDLTSFLHRAQKNTKFGQDRILSALAVGEITVN